MEAQVKQWPHAPAHLFLPNTFYMVTGATLYKLDWYKDSIRLNLLENILFDILRQRRWELQAWAVFSNHYHFIAKSPEADSPIDRLIQHFHAEASRQLNRLDSEDGRRVWYQYWDTCLTFQKSYMARLNYVMNNPVHHGLVEVASQYPFCSAGWFERTQRQAFQKTVASFKYDRLKIQDDFQPVWEE
ncbi:MAG: transposase [Terriglobia bacterium]